MISVLIADDHSVVREGIRRLIEEQPDVKVCAEAGDGLEALELLKTSEPDVALLDISMPNISGLEALERIRAEHRNLKVILFSVHTDPPRIRSAIKLGVDGYLLKNARGNEIISAIREVMRGGSYFSPAVARVIVEDFNDPDRGDKGPFDLLSARERDVLRMIALGRSAKETASELDIAAKTVEAHRTSVMRKLGVKKATELVRYAVRHGLIEP